MYICISCQPTVFIYLQALLNSLWLINRTHFNISGTQKHRNLVWGQFQLAGNDRRSRAIKFTPLFEPVGACYYREAGTISNGVGEGTSVDVQLQSCPGSECTKQSQQQPLPFNSVDIFELYSSMRPLESRGMSEPFYLCPEPMWEESGKWFKSTAAGSQVLARIPRLLGLKQTKEFIQPVLNFPSDDVVSQNLHPTDTTNKTECFVSQSTANHAPTTLTGAIHLPKQESHLSEYASNLLNFFPMMFPPYSSYSRHFQQLSNMFLTPGCSFVPNLDVQSSMWTKSFENDHATLGIDDEESQKLNNVTEKQRKLDSCVTSLKQVTHDRRQRNDEISSLMNRYTLSAPMDYTFKGNPLNLISTQVDQVGQRASFDQAVSFPTVSSTNSTLFSETEKQQIPDLHSPLKQQTWNGSSPLVYKSESVVVTDEALNLARGETERSATS